MGWDEFCAFIRAMNVENSPPEKDDLGSWKDVADDPWWVKARAEREEMQRQAG